MTSVRGIVHEIVTLPKGSGKQASVIVDWNLLGITKWSEVKAVRIELASDDSQSIGNTSQDSQLPSLSNNEQTVLTNVIAHDVQFGCKWFSIEKAWFLSNPSGLRITENNRQANLLTYMFLMLYLCFGSAKVFGILVLMPRYEFSDPRSLIHKPSWFYFNHGLLPFRDCY